MAELSRTGYADELHKSGPYKRARVWVPKQKYFKEDLQECPFDPKTGEMRKDFVEEQLKRTDLNWDGQDGS